MKSLRHFVRLLSNQPSKKYEIVSPAYVSPKTQFTDLPKNISIPPYALTGIPPQIDPHSSPEKKSDSEMGKIHRFDRNFVEVMCQIFFCRTHEKIVQISQISSRRSFQIGQTRSHNSND